MAIYDEDGRVLDESVVKVHGKGALLDRLCKEDWCEDRFAGNLRYVLEYLYRGDIDSRLGDIELYEVSWYYRVRHAGVPKYLIVYDITKQVLEKARRVTVRDRAKRLFEAMKENVIYSLYAKASGFEFSVSMARVGAEVKEPLFQGIVLMRRGKGGFVEAREGGERFDEEIVAKVRFQGAFDGGCYSCCYRDWGYG